MVGFVDTHKSVKGLMESGLNETQAERIVAAFFDLAQQTLATKSDLEGLATKSDLEGLATKAELEEFRLATKAEIKEFRLATKAEIKEFRLATETEIKELRLATKSDLESLATKAELKELRLATAADIKELNTKVDRLSVEVGKLAFMVKCLLAIVLTAIVIPLLAPLSNFLQSLVSALF